VCVLYCIKGHCVCNVQYRESFLKYVVKSVTECALYI